MVTAKFSSVIAYGHLLGEPLGALPGSLWRSSGSVKMASSSFGTLNRLYEAPPRAQLGLGNDGELLVGWQAPEDDPQKPCQGAAGGPVRTTSWFTLLLCDLKRGKLPSRGLFTSFGQTSS